METHTTENGSTTAVHTPGSRGLTNVCVRVVVAATALTEGTVGTFEAAGAFVIGASCLALSVGLTPGINAVVGVKVVPLLKQVFETGV